MTIMERSGALTLKGCALFLLGGLFLACSSSSEGSGSRGDGDGCTGNASCPDAGAQGAGADSGASGSGTNGGGQSGGDNAGEQPGEGSPDADAPGAGMSDAGGDATAPGQEPDCEDGAHRCDGSNSPARSVCEGGRWQSAACADGQLCDPDSAPAGECRPVAEGCVGKQPGVAYCDGATRIKCSDDLFDSSSEDCDSIQHCNLGQGADCAVCLDNEFRCDENVLSECNDDHTGFDQVEECTEPAPCKATAGACTPFACNEGQLRCSGDRLEECNDARSGFDLVEECGEGLCDSTNFECDICIPDSSACVDDATKLHCESDGQFETPVECGEGRPHCVEGHGCVQCRETADCEAPPCQAASCNTQLGNCEFTPTGENTSCGEGMFCDDEGACSRECVEPGDCLEPPVCMRATCSAGECGTALLEPGTGCGDGDYCSSEGACEPPPEACEEYCLGETGVLVVCAENAALAGVVGDSEESCLAACVAGTSWNIGCRNTHLGYAGSAPVPHCDHALGVSTCL